MDRLPDPETLASLTAFLRSVNRRFHPVSAVLFGSRARGTHLKSSDFDVLLVSECFRGMSFRERIIEASRDWEGDYRLDVLCYSPEELEAKRRQIGVVSEALRHGIALELPA